jgi:hypothetical protein
MYSVGEKKDGGFSGSWGRGRFADYPFIPSKSTSQTSERAKSFGKGRKNRRQHAKSIFFQGTKQRKFGTKGILDLFFSVKKHPTRVRLSKMGVHKKSPQRPAGSYLCVMRLSTLLLALCLTLLSCYRGSEGCLDPRARNFNAAADRDCCCLYYRLQAELEHRFVQNGDTLPFVLGLPYPTDAGDTVSTVSLPFLLSDLRLVRADGSEMRVANTLTLQTANGPALVPNSFVVADPGTLLADFGDVSALGTFERVRFYLGVFPAANHHDGNLPASHPLSALHPRGMYRSEAEGHTFLRPEIRLFGDTLTHTYALFGDARMVAVDLPLPQPLVLTDGMDARIGLRIVYSTLFSGISFRHDPPETIVDKLFANASGSFATYIP